MITSLENLPTPAGIRERVFLAVDELRGQVERALAPGESNQFEWHRARIWMDRVRVLALPMPLVERAGLSDATTMLESEEDNLVASDGRRSLLNAWKAVRLLAHILTDLGSPHGLVDLINYTAVQPLVNPALRSIFWLALSEELKYPRDPSEYISTTLGPMAYSMARYPESRSESQQVREAQVEFVADIDSTLDTAKALALSDAEWAERCAAVLVAQHDNLDARVFTEVWDKARGLLSPRGSAK